MLNFLSRYAGYANWDDFIFNNKQQVSVKPLTISPNRYFIIIPLLTVVILAIFFGLFKLFNTREYRFMFMDADTHEPVINEKTEIILFPEGESPVHHLVGKDGCFYLKTDKSKIKMVVKSPYYQIDTITRIVTKLDKDEKVMLKADDYALMLHYFSTMKIDDWENRRNRLNEMIGDEAMICQIIQENETAGMVLYNKPEFIDKLTMPSGNLKNIEILDTKSRDGKIMLIRFRIKVKN
jgi:hypothetical protein